MRLLASYAFIALVAATSATAGEAIDRICTPDELPSVTQPHPELSRVFAGDAEDAGTDPYTASMGAMEVVLARINVDGEIELSCVDTEAAAREFFKAPFARTKKAAEEK